MLINVFDENGLVVVNGTDLCTGVITRERTTTQRTEKSVLDFFIVCETFLALIKSMKVDEERKFALTKFSTKNGVKSVKVSDHNLLILELSIKWNSLNTNERQEMFNFQDVENFQKFEMLTESDEELRNCLDDCDDLNKGANQWMKRLNFLIQKSFRKIRIKKQKINPELKILFEEKESLRSKISELEEDKWKI